jgi:hypothetical protein
MNRLPLSPFKTTMGGWFAPRAGFTHQFMRAAKSAWNAGRHRQTVAQASVTLPTVSAASRNSPPPAGRKRPPQPPHSGCAGSLNPFWRK